MLPPVYVAQHVEHGWATTIDAAQGATTDVAIMLVRPGIDREHLYVGLTRGREENHAYLAPAADDDHAHPPARDTGARALLQAALAHSGRNDAAHTLLDRTATATRAVLAPPDATRRVGTDNPQPPPRQRADACGRRDASEAIGAVGVLHRDDPPPSISGRDSVAGDCAKPGRRR